MTVRTRIQVIDRLYVVGFTTDGRDFEPAGDGFKTPREAIDFSNELEGRPTSRRAPDLAPGSPHPGSQGLALDEAPERTPAARALPGDGGLTPSPAVAGRHIAAP